MKNLWLNVCVSLIRVLVTRPTKYRFIESGIIVFHVISGKLAKKARIEVLLDDGYWPCFSTLKARSTQAQFGYVGEGFMKELDFGRVWFRLNDGIENEKDDIIAECREDAKPFLQAALVSLIHHFALRIGMMLIYAPHTLEWTYNARSQVQGRC